MLKEKQREVIMCLIDDLMCIIEANKKGDWFVKKHCEEAFEDLLKDFWNVRKLKTISK